MSLLLICGLPWISGLEANPYHLIRIEKHHPCIKIPGCLQLLGHFIPRLHLQFNCYDVIHQDYVWPHETPTKSTGPQVLKEWLLRLVAFETFDQSDKQTWTDQDKGISKDKQLLRCFIMIMMFVSINYTSGRYSWIAFFDFRNLSNIVAGVKCF